ncbi:hypothetical protein ACW9KT_10785 [Hymenobacter sp. HD11105]
MLKIFIEQIEIAIGEREEISSVVDLTSEQIEDECNRIRATIPEVSEVALSHNEDIYELRWTIKGTGYTTEGSEFPAVAFWNGVQAFNHSGLNYTLSFPVPLVKEVRPYPKTRAQRQALDRKLRTLQHKFLDDLADEIDSTLFPQDRVELLVRILEDFDCLESIPELDPEISVGHESAWETIHEVWQEVESKYHMLETEAESLAGIIGNKESFRKAPQAAEIPQLDYEITTQQAMQTLGLDSSSGMLAVPASNSGTSNNSPESDPEMSNAKHRRRIVLLYLYRDRIRDIQYEADAQTVAESFGITTRNAGKYITRTLLPRWGSKKEILKTKRGVASLIRDIEYISQYLTDNQKAEADTDVKSITSEIN